MGIWERGREEISIRLRELKESGCVWNSGSCLSPHIPHYSRNNKLCQSRYNSLHSGYLALRNAPDHPKPHRQPAKRGYEIPKWRKSLTIFKRITWKTLGKLQTDSDSVYARGRRLAALIPTNSCGLWDKIAFLASFAENNEHVIWKRHIFYFLDL